MKKIFAFAVLFAAMSLVACGGEQPKAEEAEEVAVEEVVVEEAPAAPAVKAEKVEKVEAPAEAPKLTVSEKPLDVKVEAAVPAKKEDKFTVTKELKVVEGEAKTFDGAANAKETKLQVNAPKSEGKALKVGAALNTTVAASDKE